MVWALLLAFMVASPAVTGVVKDSTGGAVSSATVILKPSTGPEQRTVTGPDGSFSFPNAPEGQGTIIVRAGGFAETTQTVSGTQTLEIVLALPRLGEEVTVTPNRSEASPTSVPASVNVIDQTEIERSPAVIADDVLRQVPTFSLFRRTTAISANPTAQGVSLRGIGPSGVSRTLVMVDNVPSNDPFGGWVYWTKIPMEDVDRIEMVNNSSSNLYGNYAMGGVINVVSRKPQRRTLELRPQYGSRTSPKLDFFAADAWGKAGMTVNGSYFDTDGFKQVIEGERGPIDTESNVKFSNTQMKFDYAPSTNIRTFVRGGYFAERRDNAKVATANGTPVGTPNGTPEDNDTITRNVAGGARFLLRDQSDLQATLFYDSITYHQNFLAVPNPTTRDTARVTLFQKVPTENTGGMVQWSRTFATQHFFSAGTDWRWVEGESQENVMDATTGTNVITKRFAGGKQRSLGFYLQDIYSPIQKLTITASVRYDKFRSYDGHNLETSVSTGNPTANNRPDIPEREDDVVSPRLAALYRVNDRVSVWGDIAGGFRAPTLNELYRRFSVGQRLTLPNESLSPEHLKSGELGVTVAVTDNILARSTWYDNRMEDAISTIARTDINANTFQRKNLGRTRIWGLQNDVEVYLYERSLKLSGAYLYNHARVTENEFDPTLVGNTLAQVPTHRGTAQIAYSSRKYIDAALSVQMIGRQFDDEANTATVPGESEPGLPGFAIVDVLASRNITSNVDAYFGVSNIFDKEFIVQTAPTTIGAPRLVTFGLKIRFGLK